jgi:hypothetical protein
MSSSSILSRSVSLAVLAVMGFAVGRFTAPSTASHFQTNPSKAPNDHAPGSATAGAARREFGSSATERNDARLSADEQWRVLSTAKRSQQVERELSAALEEMAKTQPQRAMELAAKEPNLRSRELLGRAALRGWATVAPDAAVAAAMNLRGIDNREAIAAVLQGAAGNPETLIRLARRLTDGGDPVAIDYGNLAIAALANNGHYEDAMHFAAEGTPANRAQWLNEAFSAWARAQPQEALSEFQRITDPASRRGALHGLVAGWAEADPGSLAEYALRESVPEEREFELSQTLTNWVLRDPAAASDWLSQRDPDPNLDRGLSTIANLPSLMAQRPEIATEWAEAISDPQLRQSALRTIGEEWRRRAPGALEKFLQSGRQLTEADRASLSATAQNR